MNIATKYNIGDTVFTNDGEKIVKYIMISVYEKIGFDITYYFDSIFRGFQESEVFGSKTELIKFMNNTINKI